MTFERTQGEHNQLGRRLLTSRTQRKLRVRYTEFQAQLTEAVSELVAHLNNGVFHWLPRNRCRQQENCQTSAIPVKIKMMVTT
jgi:hypothetical protein